MSAALGTMEVSCRLDGSLQTMWSNAKQNESRYCINNGLLYEKSRKVDDRGLLLLSENLRDEVLYLVHNRLMAGHLGISKELVGCDSVSVFQVWNKL